MHTEQKQSAILPEEALIRLFEERREEAISHTQEAYGPWLEQFAARFLTDPRDREEALADTLLGVWNAIPPHRPISLKAFLTTLLRRACIKRLRHQSRKKEVPKEHLLALEELEEVLPDTGEVEDELLAQELSRTLEDFLWEQEPRRRRIFLLRYYESRPVAEVVELLSVSRSTVEKELKTLRTALRERLEKEGYAI